MADESVVRGWAFGRNLDAYAAGEVGQLKIWSDASPGSFDGQEVLVLRDSPDVVVSREDADAIDSWLRQTRDEIQGWIDDLEDGPEIDVGDHVRAFQEHIRELDRLRAALATEERTPTEPTDG